MPRQPVFAFDQQQFVGIPRQRNVPKHWLARSIAQSHVWMEARFAIQRGDPAGVQQPRQFSVEILDVVLPARGPCDQSRRARRQAAEIYWESMQGPPPSALSTRRAMNGSRAARSAMTQSVRCTRSKRAG